MKLLSLSSKAIYIILSSVFTFRYIAQNSYLYSFNSINVISNESISYVKVRQRVSKKERERRYLLRKPFAQTTSSELSH